MADPPRGRVTTRGRVRLRAGPDRYYDRLVRVAYLIADDPAETTGTVPRSSAGDRIARAHRVVRRSLPWRRADEPAYLWLLARVVRRAVNPPRLAIGLPARWGRPVPGPDAPQAERLLAALATLPTPVRAGYVLVVVEQLPPRDAIQVLHEAGWPDPVLQVAAGVAERQRLADSIGLSPDRQRELLTGPVTDPMTVRLRPPDQWTLRLGKLSRYAVLVAAAAAVAVAVGLTPQLTGGAPETARPPGPIDEPDTAGVRRVGDQSWLGAAQPTLASWPTRGSLVDDAGLIDAALGAWLALAEHTSEDPQARAEAYRWPGPEDPDRDGAGLVVPTGAGPVSVRAGRGVALAPPAGAAQLVYAGELAGTGGDPMAVAVLADATRIAVYRSTGNARSMRVEQAPAANLHTASAIRLSEPVEPARYLVAPWVRRIEYRAFTDGQWRELTVRAGLTDPAGPAESSPTRPAESSPTRPAGSDPTRPAEADAPAGCWPGPVLRVHPTEVSPGAPFTLADLGPAALSRLGYLPPDADPVRVPDEADGTAGARVWSSLGCLAGDLAGHAPDSVLAWEVWSGTLPGSTDEIRLSCVRAELPRDANLVAAALLVPGRPARAVATAADTRLCSPLAPAVAIGWWWESPTGGWHHVAVSGGSVAQIEVTIGGQRARGSGLLVSPEFPNGPVGPVRLRATDDAGRPVPVLD